MAKKNSKIIKEAYGEYEVLTGEDEVKRLAEVRLMSKLEEQAALAAARKEGYEKGFKKGRVMGLLKSNMPIEQIIEITELDKQEIEKIKQENRD